MRQQQQETSARAASVSSSSSSSSSIRAFASLLHSSSSSSSSMQCTSANTLAPAAAWWRLLTAAAATPSRAGAAQQHLPWRRPHAPPHALASTRCFSSQAPAGPSSSGGRGGAGGKSPVTFNSMLIGVAAFLGLVAVAQNTAKERVDDMMQRSQQVVGKAAVGGPFALIDQVRARAGPGGGSRVGSGWCADRGAAARRAVVLPSSQPRNPAPLTPQSFTPFPRPTRTASPSPTTTCWASGASSTLASPTAPTSAPTSLRSWRKLSTWWRPSTRSGCSRCSSQSTPTGTARQRCGGGGVCVWGGYCVCDCVGGAIGEKGGGGRYFVCDCVGERGGRLRV